MERIQTSCGAVAYTVSRGEVRYILVRSETGSWGFPKGHMEAGETQRQTAEREVREETGARAEFAEGFRRETVYDIPLSKTGGVEKHAVFFLARCEGERFEPQDREEIAQIRTAPFGEAVGMLRHEDLKQILREADGFLRTRGDARTRERTASMLRCFDGHDARLPYHELMLERDLTDIPALPLPDGYRFETFGPGGKRAWIEIEKSAGELESDRQGEEVWDRFFAGEKCLARRMFFVVNGAGERIATASALYDIRTGDDGETGWLHWVAVRRDEQGHALSKPLVARVLRRMAEMGYSRAVVPTQTTTWLACRVYLDMGFRPIPKNAERSRAGWEIVRALTGHPALEGFAEADVERYLKEQNGQ